MINLKGKYPAYEVQDISHILNRRSPNMKTIAKIIILSFLILLMVSSTIAFASDGSTGALTGVVAKVGSDMVAVDITQYASAYSAGSGNQLFNYLSGGSGIVLKAVVSGTKYMDVTVYASAYAAHGSNAIANTPALPQTTIQNYKKFEGFNPDGSPKLTPIFEDTLKFELDSYDISEGEVETYAERIYLTGKVSGGSGNYTFSKEGYWPSWLDISKHSSVYISGERPTEGQDATSITVKVTDNETGKTATVDINVGAVYYGPINLVNYAGFGTFVLNKEKPYFDGWSAVEKKPVKKDYVHYNVYTRTLTLNNLYSNLDIVAEENHLNVITNGENNRFGAIKAKGNININGDGKLELSNDSTHNGSIHSTFGGVTINGGDIKIEVSGTDNFGIKAVYGPVNIGGNTKLDIYVGSNGTNNYGIYAPTSYPVNIKDRAIVEIEVNNAANNYGIYAHNELNITSKGKLVIKTDTSKQGKAASASKITAKAADYTINGSWDSRGLVTCIYNGDPEDVSAIKVKTLPEKHVYFVGQKLDLTGLVVTLEKEETENIEVPFAKFDEYGITATPSNNKLLTLTDTVINLTHGASGAIGHLPITVNPVELTFIYDESYNIPAGPVDSSITPIDISKGVYGGTPPYSYEIGYFELQPWDAIKSTLYASGGLISGTRAAKNTPAKAGYITVTDSASKSATQYITIGGVETKGSVKIGERELDRTKPYLVNNGEPMATPLDGNHYNAYFDACSSTLYLNDYKENIPEGTNLGLKPYSLDSLVIDIKGNNELTGGIDDRSTTYDGSLVFKGSGTLKMDLSKRMNGIYSQNNIYFKGGKIEIDQEYDSNNQIYYATGIKSLKDVIFEGDSKVTINLNQKYSYEGTKAEPVGVSGINTKFLGNSQVSINVRSEGAGSKALDHYTSLNNKVYITTTGFVYAIDGIDSLSKGSVEYNGDLYQIEKGTLGDRKISRYRFKGEIAENRPYIAQIVSARRPHTSLVYYNQPLILTGFEVEIRDQYGNKTLVPMELLADKGISIAKAHGEIFPEGADENITFWIDNENIGRVSGYLGIKARYKEVPVTSIKLDEYSVALETSQTTRLTATVYPTNATHKKLLWSSSNPEIASVDANGNIVAKAIGEATITVRTADGKVKVTGRVSVYK